MKTQIQESQLKDGVIFSVKVNSLNRVSAKRRGAGKIVGYVGGSCKWIRVEWANGEVRDYLPSKLIKTIKTLNDVTRLQKLSDAATISVIVI